MKTICFERIDSTNSYLKRNYETLQNMTFVSASMQTCGRGRYNRRWNSKKGENLLFSLLIKDEELIACYPCISMLMAYSLLQILKNRHIPEVSIKWPNDVYCDGKKICGILLEGIVKEKMECLIIGIGLNVNQKKFDNELLHEATSLALQSGCEIPLADIREEVYQQITLNLNKLKAGHDFFEEIKECDYLKNQEVWAIVKEEKKKIKILGIDRDYSLRALLNGEMINLNSGEISFHL